MDHNKIVYQDCGSFPLFDNDWKASEEVALLEAVELYNYGNWSDIAEYIPNKTVDQIRQHFVDYYVRGTLGQVVWETVKDKGNTVQDHTSSAEGPLSPSLAQQLPVISELSPSQQSQLGYMPNRDDFEREYDNEIESLVATLSMNVKEEDDLDRDMKLAYIDIYNRRLSERFRRKEIVRRYELIKLFYTGLEKENDDAKSDTSRNDGEINDLNNKTAAKDSKESSLLSKVGSIKTKTVSPVSKNNASVDVKLKEYVKVFTQFLNRSQYEELLLNLPREREMISRIRELIRFRRYGFKKLSDLNKEKRKEIRKYEGNAGNTGSGLRSTGLTAKSLETISASSKNSGSKSNSIVTPAVNRTGINSSEVKVLNSGHSFRKDAKDSQRQNTVEAKLANSLELNLRKSSYSTELKSLSPPAYKLLSAKERKLIASLNLTAKQYTNLKTLIIKETLKKTEKGQSALKNIDKSIRRKLFTFFTRNGWLCSGRHF